MSAALNEKLNGNILPVNECFVYFPIRKTHKTKPPYHPLTERRMETPSERAGDGFVYKLESALKTGPGKVKKL